MFIPMALFFSYFHFTIQKNLTRSWMTIIALSLIIPISIELIQMFWSYRIFDVDDIILNFVGTIFGAGSFFYLHSLRKRLTSIKKTATGKRG